MKNRYVIVMPARNEQAFITTTLDAIVAQTILPYRLVVVDDGSTDRTAEIVAAYIKLYSWISLITLPDLNTYEYGRKIIIAFQKGYKQVTGFDFEFVVKLDADLSFSPGYFENLLNEFQKDQLLGIASGQTYYRNPREELVWEDAPLHHTFGPCKMYRCKCFRDIGGPKPVLGWDHIDEVEARMNGWKTRSYPELKLIHLRKMGSRQGVLAGYKRHGKADYLTGYHWLYFFLKSLYRVFSKPYLVGSIASAVGFFSSMIKNEKKVVDRSFEKFYRKEQLMHLFNSKFWKLYFQKFKSSV